MREFFFPTYYHQLLLFGSERENIIFFPFDCCIRSTNPLFHLRSNPDRLLAVTEYVALADHSLGVKFGVQWGICGGTICKLGTERHRQYLQGLGSFDVAGCFALTGL